MQIGLIGLLKSRKATMSLIIVACATVGLFIGKLDGPSFAAVIGTVAVIYNFCQHAVDKAELAIPERGR